MQHVDDSELAARLIAEYREMPGLCLSVAQAMRLWRLEHDRCLAVLQHLEASGALRRTTDGRYVSGRLAGAGASETPATRRPAIDPEPL